ncbi:hypothetical protein Goklo_018242, partial [Gossypium klotzschianum]|nr:hypothetical protein [Gossypium klotzschianum]
MDLFGGHKNKISFIRLGTSSGRNPPNSAPNPNLRIIMNNSN